PHDFDRNDSLATSLPATVLRNRLEEMVRRGANVVLIIDSCFSGSIVAPEGVILLVSSQAHQSSMEHGLIGNGLFTKALLEAFSGKADNNGDGLVDLEEIEAYVSVRVPELIGQYSSGRPTEQKPTSVRPGSIRGTLPLVQCRK